MIRPRLRYLAAPLLCAALLPAQQGDGAATPREWISLAEYSERVSRAAFAICDGDADDRLSVLESSRTLEGIGTDDLEAFRRLDSDADGFLYWPDFDRRFRELTERGAPMRIRPLRPVPADLAPAAALAAAKPTGLQRANQLIAENDTDGDGKLSLLEAARVAATLIPGADPAALVAPLRALDVDRSGDIGAAELLIVADRLPLASEQRSAATSAPGKLPPGYAAADANADGVIDRAELESVLRGLDPALPRWSRQILRDADRSGNDTLGPFEIRQAGS